MANERATFGARLIVKAKQRGKLPVYENQTLEARFDRRQFSARHEVRRNSLVPPGDVDLMAVHSANKPLAGLLADAGGNRQGDLLPPCRVKNSLRQRVPGVLFQTGGITQRLSLVYSRRAVYIRQRRASVCQRPRLIEEERPAGIDLLENLGMFDDDAAS